MKRDETICPDCRLYQVQVSSSGAHFLHLPFACHLHRSYFARCFTHSIAAEPAFALGDVSMTLLFGATGLSHIVYAHASRSFSQLLRIQA